MALKQKKYMENIICYIEQNLTCDLNLHQLTKLSHLSLMQLYRDFYSFTGHSVKEYIKKRRLSNALALLKCSDMSLADIVYSCGYSSQQFFCKCVKNTTKFTPLEYKQSENYYYFPPFNSDAERQISVASETIPSTICCKFYHSQLCGIENRAVNYLLTLPLKWNGRIFGKNGTQEGKQFCYELYLEYESGMTEILKNSDFSDFHIVPGYTAAFATTIIPNKEEEINRAWDYLYIDWLKNSMFEQADKPYFEEYIYKDGQIKKLVLYLPVEKRGEHYKITIKTCNPMTFLISRKSGRNAEENASKAVIEFLSSHYPYLVKTTREFYVAKNGMEYVCGVKLEKELHLPQDRELEILHLDEGSYAVLEGDCCGDSSVYEACLLSWVNDNGFDKDTSSVFTVYKTDGSFQRENIKTKIFVKLKKC